jgi:ribose transport system substrate-binding protein
LRSAPESESTEKREQGFLDAIARHPKIEVLSGDRRGGPTESDAVTASESLLAKFKDRVDGAFCSSESATHGFLTALSRDELDGRIAVVGFGSSAKIEAALATGALRATVIQDPERMGYLAVVAMHTLLSGGKPEPRIDSGQRLIHFPDLPHVDTRFPLGYSGRPEKR